MYVIGYRFWKIDEQGSLYSPFEGNNTTWQENNIFTTSKGIGIHAWKHSGQKNFCNHSYFNPQTASLHNSRASNRMSNNYYIVGAIIGKYPKFARADEIIVDRAIVGALSLPLDADPELIARANLSSQKYLAKIVTPQQLYSSSEGKLELLGLS